MKKNVTIYTLADELGMTPSMVSRAFNPDARIAAEKRQAVLKLAGEYGFSPNKLASRLSMRTVKIGVLIVYKAEHVRDGLLAGIQQAFKNTRDYKIEYSVKTVCAAEKCAADCRDELFSFVDFDGVILSGFSSSECMELLCSFAEKNPNIVFMQNLCENAPRLFASKHDEKFAAALASQLLAERLHYKKRKNVLLFTGDLASSVHRNARSAFEAKAVENDLKIIGSVDMHDSDLWLSDNIAEIFEKYLPDTDGIYITSGNSSVLCEAVRKSGRDISLICSDVHEKVCEYIENGTVFAALCQNFSMQSQTAFEKLTEYLIGNASPEETVYSEVVPVFKSNISLYRNK